MSIKSYDRFERVFDAVYPRYNKNATIPPNSKLEIVCDHYKLRENYKSSNRRSVNLYLLHGTGMTKAIWRYYAKKLFEISESNKSLTWQIVNIVAMDLVTHGESAMLNAGKLGYEFDWRDGGRDIVKIASEMNFEGDNVAIGHSMGGFQAVYGASEAPTLFKFVVPIEAVSNQRGDTATITKRFDSLLAALNKVVVDNFKNEKEYEEFFRKKSFYRKFNKEILEDLLQSEKLIHPDGTCSTKTSKEHQMLGYCAGFTSFPIALEQANRVKSPIVHVIGDKATWNEREAVDIYRKEVKNAVPVDIKNGEHLVNGEQPDDVIEVIVDSLNKYITGEPEFQNSAPMPLDEYHRAFRAGYSVTEKEHFIKKKPAKL